VGGGGASCGGGRADSDNGIISDDDDFDDEDGVDAIEASDTRAMLPCPAGVDAVLNGQPVKPVRHLPSRPATTTTTRAVFFV
jgi:hypothetical protein